jgi:ABC-type multidrug transport system permease subunit
MPAFFSRAYHSTKEALISTAIVAAMMAALGAVILTLGALLFGGYALLAAMPLWAVVIIVVILLN